MSAGGVVDPTVLDALTDRLGERGPAFRSALLQTWREETTARLADVDAAAAAGDADGVSRAAHTMKSAAGSLGASTMSSLCDQVEAGLRAGRTRDLAADAVALRRAAADADAAFTVLWPTEG